jgi:lipid-A-disaccharide synthase-like uncharacterized protein
MLDQIIKEIQTQPVWTILGFLGQGTFCARFMVQWLASEKKKRSHVPVVFWYLSLLGTVLLLIYSIHKADPVFIAGFSLNGLIYVRNLQLINKQNSAVQADPGTTAQ